MCAKCQNERLMVLAASPHVCAQNRRLLKNVLWVPVHIIFILSRASVVKLIRNHKGSK